MATAALPDHRTDPYFWNGWLASAFAILLQRIEADDDYGPGAVDEHAVFEARTAWRAFADSPMIGGLEQYDEQQYDGYVVESATGEAQAYRETFEQATAAVADVEAYWYGAETCGHHLAASSVARLRPFRVRQITRAERDELREYPPVIDREP